jgi:sulfite reductase (NADPH) hemoprotein beta-component
MYRFDALDQALVDARVEQFREQLGRHLDGRLSDEDFRPLRLQNGLYLQRHAPMLRVAIPYGLLASRQLRALAEVARRWDRGFGHLTTRQNIQFNWVQLEAVPDILAYLARFQLHAIQTSGNCIRNTTTDHFAGIAPDEVVNPLLWCELIRQWSTLHPEFAYLPRKFKIAVSGSTADRAAVQVHDIGLQACRRDGEIGFRVLAGGGLGRTPMIGSVIREWLPWPHLLTYLEAILRVYNRHGRRDNKYKARIKILFRALGAEAFAAQVEAEWAHLRDGPETLLPVDIEAMRQRFDAPELPHRPEEDLHAMAAGVGDPRFSAWLRRNVHPHRVPGHAAVTVSLKAPGVAPGDVSAAQMDIIADLADRHGFGELRVSHEQNLILPDVAQQDLHALWQALDAHRLATPTVGLLGNIIACPGGDFCSLANARSIPVAAAIQARFEQIDFQHDLGELDLNISGCMNACGHHHVGHIGILGVDKHGQEYYQITIGGQQGNRASIGTVIGPSVAAAAVPEVIAALLAVYLEQREHADERFVDVVQRIGVQPFKERAYGLA